MKREAMTHPKMQTLVKRLSKTNGGAIARGVLEGLWHLAGQHAPDGDLSRFSPDEIAGFIGWDEDASELLAVLVETRWLDRIGDRVVVHDWSDHADGSVHKKLARAKRFFANGRKPILSHLGGPKSFERKAAEAFYTSTEPPRSFHGTPAEFRGTEPEPRQSPAPPEPEPFSSSLRSEEKHAAVPDRFREAVKDTKLARLLNGAAPKDWWQDLEKQEALYSWLDVSEELRAAGRWLKTRQRKHLAKFFDGWLNRAIERGREKGRPGARTFGNGRGA
jgi:hypothetical protein